MVSHGEFTQEPPSFGTKETCEASSYWRQVSGLIRFQLRVCDTMLLNRGTGQDVLVRFFVDVFALDILMLSY